MSEATRRRNASQKRYKKKLPELEGGCGDLYPDASEIVLVMVANSSEQRGLKVKRLVDFPIPYKGRKLSKHFRIDVLVQDLVLVDTKAVTDYHDIFETQMLTYLRLTGLKLGMVINFGEKLVKDGIHRVVNGL